MPLLQQAFSLLYDIFGSMKSVVTNTTASFFFTKLQPMPHLTAMHSPYATLYEDSAYTGLISKN
jgi:hypothetical protein